MELVIGIVLIAVIGYIVFWPKNKEEVKDAMAPEAPYKVETPAPVPAAVTAAIVEGAGEVAAPAKAKKAPAKKAPAKKPAAAKKAPAKKAPAKAKKAAK
jgi:septal ring-binding cell division protein DamX